ncbi:MAG: hypothetical protein RL757_1785 [Bacteroidota bacterium]
MIKNLIKLLSKNKNETPIFKQRLIFFGKNVLGLLLILATTFFWVWGFNYGRTPFQQQIGINETNKITLDSTILKAELDSLPRQLLFWRNEKSKMPPPSINPDFEAKMRSLVAQSLQKMGLPTYNFQPRLRQLAPNGSLMRFGATGVYWLWAGECNMDNGLHALQKPFTAAHELAHGFGWTDESVCNFIAYIATTLPDADAETRYSGELSYFRYVASNFRRLYPKTYLEYRKNLPPELLQDLEEINKNIAKYQNWIETASFYDQYLKTQGVASGVKSYDEMVTLVLHWKLGKK